MTPDDFLTKARLAAVDGGHIWPDYAACEAALESGWGESKLCRLANNVFGQKQGFTTGGVATISIPTREFLNGEWVTVDALWPKFPDWASAFRARMRLLNAKSAYATALAANSGEEFVKEVSRVWATDPERANKVLSIFRQHCRG